MRRLTLDEELVNALRKDYKNASLSEAERKMCDFALLITKDVLVIQPSHHDELRAVGFNDTAILQITLIASWFNYINRVADTLGIGREKRA